MQKTQMILYLGDIKNGLMAMFNCTKIYFYKKAQQVLKYE